MLRTELLSIRTDIRTDFRTEFCTEEIRMEKFVIYTRVSTKSQGKSGLGLEAQQRDIQLYLNNYAPDHQILGEFQEIESGSKSSRETLKEAINWQKRRCCSARIKARSTLKRR